MQVHRPEAEPEAREGRDANERGKARGKGEAGAQVFDSTRQYLNDVRSEFKKVTWPSQREYVGGTVAVLVISLVITLVLSLIDMGLGQIMRLVLS